MLWSKGSWMNYTANTSKTGVPYCFGDVNGDGKVNLMDSLLTNKCSVGYVVFDKKQKYAADLDDDFEIKLIDAISLQKYVVSVEK